MMTGCIFAYTLDPMSEHWSLRYARHAIEQLKTSPSGLAERIGVSSTTLTRPLNSKDHKHVLGRQTLDKIAAATGIPYGPFQGGAAEDEARKLDLDEGGVPDRLAMIDVHDVRASAGNGAIVESEDVVDRLSFPLGYLDRITRTHPRHLKIISVKGDSMHPTLHDDDVVMLDLSKTSLDYDGLFVLRFGDALHVKRVGRAPGGAVRIISDSEAFPDLDLPRQEVEAVGKVIWIGKKV